MINFLKNLFGLSLKSKVLKAVHKKLDEAQKVFDREVASLNSGKKQSIRNAKSACRSQVSNARSNYRSEVSNAENKHLNQILAKIL